MEVGAQMEKRGHDHVSGGSGAGVEEEDFHGAPVPLVPINTNWSEARNL